MAVLWYMRPVQLARGIWNIRWYPKQVLSYFYWQRGGREGSKLNPISRMDVASSMHPSVFVFVRIFSHKPKTVQTFELCLTWNTQYKRCTNSPSGINFRFSKHVGGREIYYILEKSNSHCSFNAYNMWCVTLVPHAMPCDWSGCTLATSAVCRVVQWC